MKVPLRSMTLLCVVGVAMPLAATQVLQWLGGPRSALGADLEAAPAIPMLDALGSLGTGVDPAALAVLQSAADAQTRGSLPFLRAPARPTTTPGPIQGQPQPAAAPGPLTLTAIVGRGPRLLAVINNRPVAPGAHLLPGFTLESIDPASRSVTVLGPDGPLTLSLGQ